MDDATLIRLARAQQLGNIPAAQTLVDPNAGMSPGIGGAFNRVKDIAGKATDYAPIAGIAKAIQRQALEDQMAGSEISMLGGKHLSGYGRQLTEAALERGKPFRPNAADTAYVNPETGDILSNPHTDQQRELKVAEFELQRRLEEEKARLGRELTASEKEAARLQKREQDIRHDETLRYIAGLAAQAKRDAASGKGGTKALSSTEMDKLQGVNNSYGLISSVMKDYKPEYAGTITGKYGADTEKWTMSNMPEATDYAKRVVGIDPAPAHARQGWWRAQEALDTLPERHKLFGAALTPGEEMSWRGASIQQGMSDADIRKHMATRLQILENKAKELHGAQVANQKHPQAVRKGLSNIPDSVLGNPVDEEAVVEVTPPPKERRAPPDAARIKALNDKYKHK